MFTPIAQPCLMSRDHFKLREGLGRSYDKDNFPLSSVLISSVFMSGLGSGLINNIYDYEKLFYESFFTLRHMNLFFNKQQCQIFKINQQLKMRQ